LIEETTETGLGFVDKFAALFTLRQKLETVRSVTGKRMVFSIPACMG